MSALITYEFLHHLRRRDPRRVYEDFAACMNAFASAPTPSTTALLLDMAADDDPGLNAAYEELCRDYGPYPKKQRGFGTDGREWRAFQWPFPAARLDAALEYTGTLQARGGVLAMRAAIRVGWSFLFMAPEAHEMLPGQDALPILDLRRRDRSSILLTLRSDSAAASLWLMFPFTDPDATFRSFVIALQSMLPVKLSPRHWRRWSRSRSGEWKPGKLTGAP